MARYVEAYEGDVIFRWTDMKREAVALGSTFLVALLAIGLINGGTLLFLGLPLLIATTGYALFRIARMSYNILIDLLDRVSERRNSTKWDEQFRELEKRFKEQFPDHPPLQ